MPTMGGWRIVSLMKRLSLRALALSVVMLATIGATANLAQAKSVVCDEAGNCKVYCSQTLPNGNFVEYEEGTKITATDKDGRTHTFVCKNGQWVQQALTVPSTGIFGNVSPNNIGPIQLDPETPIRSDTDPFYIGPRRPTFGGCNPDTVGCPGG
jgi:hypothetical protein